MLDSTVAMLKFLFTFFIILAQETSVNISSPQTGETVRGQVEIIGDMDVPNFLSAELDFSYTFPNGNGSNLIKNGNFVQGLEHWIASGAVSVVPLPGVGKSAFLTTGCVGSVCAIGNVRSELKQSFAVGSTLQVKFNYNFLSNEFPAFVGSVFNDAFEAKLIGPNGGSTLLATESVNSSTFKPGNGTGFNGQTGPESIDTTMKVSSGQYTLSFSVADKGDTIVDTAVHVNNVSVTKK